MLPCFVFVFSALVRHITQEYCLRCNNRLSTSQRKTGRRTCKSCCDKIRNDLLLASTPPPATTSPPPILLFDRIPSSLAHLTVVERAAAVTLRRLGQTQAEAAEHLGCTRQTVAHWECRYENTGQVCDTERNGKPRKTTELEDSIIVMASTIQHFDTPRQLKRKLELNVSPRTVDRRLIEADLPGRVAQHEKEFSDVDKRRRLSFAEGYQNWTNEQWDRVVFSDEKKFYGNGFCGRVWVRRPPGEAPNSEYCVDKQPHPVKVNMWGCFCGRGLGYSYVFCRPLDATLFTHILDTHLLSSAELHFNKDPPEQWWYLQDNDPKHKSRKAQNWLHNHGITCLDFPPYSPDLNPIENLWNDIARRVELRQAETMEQLQDVVAEEWAATSTDLLAKLAHSMPTRCRLVVEAKGGHINY
jgi:transposase